MKTPLKELARMAGGEFIRMRGRYALVRWPNGLGGQVTLESRQTLEVTVAELEALTPRGEE